MGGQYKKVNQYRVLAIQYPAALLPKVHAHIHTLDCLARGRAELYLYSQLFSPSSTSSKLCRIKVHPAKIDQTIERCYKILPTEVILEIAHCLDYDSEINALSQASHRLYNTLNRLPLLDKKNAIPMKARLQGLRKDVSHTHSNGQ
ncbi:hypothetical protein BJX70DRAFT_175898 [Aspergillus crustosus]